MRLLLVFAAVVLAETTPNRSLPAQDSLRVLRHTPGDSAMPTSVVIVTFDRPIAGTFDQTSPPERVLRFAPDIAGIAVWRDPVTLRFTPAMPLQPGVRYAVSVDTNVRGVDGAKLVAPYRFTFRVPGPRLLARSFDRNVDVYADTLPPNGRIRLLYTAPVDLDRLGRGLRIDLPKCAAATTVAYRAVRQHPFGAGDPPPFEWIGGSVDSVTRRLKTVVELEPETPPPLDCAGALVIPTTSDDSSFGREERYSIATAPAFRLRQLTCALPNQSCHGDQLVLWFTSAVTRADVERHIRVNAQPVVVPAGTETSRRWTLKLRLDPRSRFTATADSALRDMYGRPLDGPRELSVSTDDHAAELRHAIGSITTPRSGPRTFPLRSINVRSIRIIAYRIPDSLRMRAMQAVPGYGDLYPLTRGLRAETTTVSLPDRLNADTTTEIPVPAVALAADHPLVAMRIEMREPLPDMIPGKVSAQRHAIVASWPERSDGWYYPFTLLQMTDLALTGRLVGLTDGMVFVTGLGDGRPRANVTVTQLDVTGRVIGRGISDAAGLARLVRLAPDSVAPPRTPISPTGRPTYPVLQAQSADDRLILALGGRAIGYGFGGGLDASTLGARFDDAPLAAGAVFAERGIFRPGEVVHVKGIVRDGLLGALRMPALGDSARLTIRQQSYSWAQDSVLTIRDTVIRLSSFGTLVDSVRLRPGLPLGGYAINLEVVVDGKWRRIRSSNFQLREYRTPEFAVEAAADTAVRYLGDTLTVRVRASYYFGAPLKGAPVHWRTEMNSLESDIHIPGASGWIIGDRSWYGRSVDPPANLSGVDTLDADGRFVLRIPTAAWTPGLSGMLFVSTAISDVSRQVVTADALAPFNASRVFILARSPGKDPEWQVGTPSIVEVRVVDARGKAVRDASVRVVVVRTRDVPFDAVSGMAARSVTDTVKQELLQAKDGAGSLTVTPSEPGVYEVELSTTDARGAPSRTTLGRYARPSASLAWSSGENKYHLKLAAERMQLKVGQATRIHFDSPFADAEAWIAIEREGIIEQRRQRAHFGDNVFEFRASERHVPNVFASVVLLARADAMTRPDTATARLRAGYLELAVARDRKQLSVAIETDRRSYAPRDTARLRLHVRDAHRRGVRSEVAIWAVDEGVLALTGFSTPDVLSQVYQQRGVGTPLWSTMPTMITTDPSAVAFLLGRSEALRLALGSAASNSAIVVAARSPGDDLRTRFSSTAFYLGQVETNDRGDATTRATLPDNLTTFRVMAVAVSNGDGYGHGDTTLLVTRPLVARPALPRFVRPTDSLLAGVVVTPRDGKPRSATAQVSASGLSVLSPATMRIALSSGASAEARFVVRAPVRDVIGDSVTLRLGATDGPSSDATETRLPVRPDFHPRTHAVLGAVRDSQDVAIVLPAGVDPQRSRMRLRIGTSPLSTMLAAYRWLRAYRFDCTEQIASTGRALVAVWQATKRERTDALGGDPRAKLQELVDEISRRQAPDGSISYWPNDSWKSTWLTAYAAAFLLDARDAGVAVAPNVITRAGNFLRAAADAPIDTGGMNRYEQRERRLRLGDRVAAVEFLRRAGTPDTTAERRLLALTPGMTWEDRLRLAETLASSADLRASAIALVDDAWKAVTTAGHRVDLPDSSHAPRAFPSRIAPAARMLSASLALEPTHPLLGALTETVLQQGRAESAFAWNTQDYAAVVMALAGLADVDAGDRVVHARGGGASFTARRPKTGIDTTITAPLTGMLETAPNGAGVLRLHLDATAGDRPIFYALEVEEVPLTAPVTPDVQGMVVERWYERFEDGSPIMQVKEGDLVRVRLRVTVPADRAFVALEDPLPAGLEPIDVGLKTSGLDAFSTPESQRPRFAADGDPQGSIWQSLLYGSWDENGWSPWEHRELHDDRVSYFARVLWTGTYRASYVARATTAGSFVAPPAYAEEMYNPALQGRSGGGRFTVERTP